MMTRPTKIRIEKFDRENWLGRRRFYFRMKVVRGGEIIAPSEAYNDRRDRDHMAELLRDNLLDAEIVTVPR
jgi:hypothetical protein